MRKHTPVPWKVIDSIQHDAEGSYTVRRLVGQVQCKYAIGQPWVDETIAIIESGTADENLIASAPAMYEALVHLEEVLADQSEETFERELIRIRYALAQADGRD